MPAYEFRCENCDFDFTAIASDEECEGIRCPKCRSEDVFRVMSSCFARNSSDLLHGFNRAPESMGIGSGKG